MTIDITNIDNSFVDVINESSHKEIFNNEYVRSYLVDIKPGQSTKMHRHTEDTVYIILEGGWIRSQNLRKEDKYPIIFLSNVTLIEKMVMKFSQWIRGDVYMAKGITFLLKHKEHPIIHQATASEKNIKNMVMMGIELKNKDINLL